MSVNNKKMYKKLISPAFLVLLGLALVTDYHFDNCISGLSFAPTKCGADANTYYGGGIISITLGIFFSFWIVYDNYKRNDEE